MGKVLALDDVRTQRLSRRGDELAAAIGIAGTTGTARERKELEAIALRFKELAKRPGLSRSEMQAEAEKLMTRGEEIGARFRARVFGAKA